MNDTLELEPRTEVATAAATALDLERIDLTKIALAKFGDWLGDVSAVTANLNTMVLDLSTAAKCKEARSLRQRLIGTPVADARKIAAGIKSKMAATSKAVGAELEIIEQAYDKADTLILPKIEAREQELEAERQEKARIEAERVRVLKERMATIGAYLTACQAPGMTAARIEKGIELLKQQTFGPEWEEFQVPAANAQCETLEAMRWLHAQVLGREQAAARQEAIRLENARQAKALAEERARIEAEAAAIRREAAELAAAKEAQRIQEMKQAAAALPDLPEQRVGEIMRGFPQPTPVTAAGFASLGERFTDEDPAAATKIPTGEVFETTDPQEGVGRMEVAPAAEQATISLTALKEWLQMPSGLTREFVEARGIKPAIEGRSILFTATQRREFKAALIKFIEGLPA